MTETDVDRRASALEHRVDAVVENPRVRQVTGAIASVVLFYVGVQWLSAWGGRTAPIGVLIQGLVIGGLTALVAFGISIVYRANRIVNFAAGDLGALPASFGVLLIVGPGVPFLLALPISIVAGIALGAVVDFVLIRRFFRAPRLVLTVITIGLSQLLAGLGFLLPRAFDINTPPQSFPSPFDVTFSIGNTVFTGNHVLAMVATVALIAGLGAFFRSTNIGIAIRASAESADRASLLGVPVKRIETVVWVLATVLATVAVFLRAGVLGLPFGQLVGPAMLVRALGAAVIGRMERLGVILVASLALGVVENAIIYSTGRASMVDPLVFAVVLVALLLQRRGPVARSDGASSWQAARDVRNIPRELAGLPEVVWGRRIAGVALGAVVLALPVYLSNAQISLAAVIAMFSIVGLSLVVLTGWAGQVSLGQVAFLAIGAATGSFLSTTWGWDLSLALVGGGLAGAVAATLIGLPALRIRGLYLAVTTLSFALAVPPVLLDRDIFPSLPEGRFDRPLLLWRIALDTETRFYYFAVAVLALAVVCVRALRRSRTGRVLIGVRENERAAQAFAVNATAAKLTAFAISGFMAAFAGAMFVHHQQNLAAQPYGVEESFAIFIEVVVGGLASPAGAILGVTVIEGLNYYRNIFPETIQNFVGFFTGSVGLMFVLLMMPGGLVQGLYSIRDRLLREVARRRGIVVPSLLADAREDSEHATGSKPPPVAVDLVAAAAEGAAFAPDADAADPALDPAPGNGNGRKRSGALAGRKR